MSENKPKSQTIKIKCCYCKLELLKRNYKEHISNKHPGRDSNDLTGADQQSLLHMFSDKRPNKDSQASHSKKLKAENQYFKNNNRHGIFVQLYIK